jgi:MFS family permease
MHRTTSSVASEFSDVKQLPRQTSTAASNKFRSAVADSHAKTLAAVKETAPDTPKQVHNVRIYLVAFALCMGAAAYGAHSYILASNYTFTFFGIGYDTGFFGGTIALDSFQRDFGLTDKSDDEKDAINANLVSLFQGGSFFGAALQLPITQKFGRKWSIIISNILFIASPLIESSDSTCSLVCLSSH